MTTIAELDVQVNISKTETAETGKPSVEFEQRWHDLKLCLDDFEARIEALENP